MGIDPKMLPERYRKQIYEQQKTKTVVAGASDPKPECVDGRALDGVASNEKGDRCRRHVCIIRYAVRLLDADNFAGGCKLIIDRLRYGNFIEDDSPEFVELSFRQVKVKTKAEQGTMIEIEEI